MTPTIADLALAGVVAGAVAGSVLPWRSLTGGGRLWRVASRPRPARDGGTAGPSPAGPGTGPGIDLAVVLELLAVALGAGTSLPRALRVTGEAAAGADGDRLVRAAAALELGASWEEAWRAPAAGGASRGVRGRRRARDARAAERTVALVRYCLRAAWVDGAAPGPLLRAAEERLAHDDAAAAQVAAERLGVRLVLPLGACLLPAFVLMGLVPVVVALGGELR